MFVASSGLTCPTADGFEGQVRATASPIEDESAVCFNCGPAFSPGGGAFATALRKSFKRRRSRSKGRLKREPDPGDVDKPVADDIIPGGFDWSNKRKNSGQLSRRSNRSGPAVDEEDVGDTETHACDCPLHTARDAAGRTTDSNQNTAQEVDVTVSNGVCTCGKAGRIKRKRRCAHHAPRETVILNVGGQVFETYRSTLERMDTALLSREDRMRRYYRPEKGDYFFDRDPLAFCCVLNYLRTGELHIPTNMCGPSLQNELDFWGIEELDIERCCWTQYNTWKTQSRSLEKLEYDRKLSTTQDVHLEKSQLGCWARARARMWRFLQDPTASRGAKAYAWVSIIFVFFSIFSFCAETHPLFRVEQEQIQGFEELYHFLNLEVRPWIVAPPSDPASVTNASYNSSVNVTSDSEETTLPHPALVLLDLCCLVFFTLEFMSRFICSPSKTKFMRSLQNIIDFVAIVPDYVEFLYLIFDPKRGEAKSLMDFLVILRMLRLCRIFRLIRHVPGLWILLYTLKASFNELMLMFVFLLIGMVVFASLIHFAEGKKGFDNIPVGFWWSVVTMTTVGYGDMYPKTAAGYVIGSFCAICGLLMIAFTVPIIVSNFVLYYTHVQYGLARRDRERERLEKAKEEDSDWVAPDLPIANPVRPTPDPDPTAIELGETIALTSSSSPRREQMI